MSESTAVSTADIIAALDGDREALDRVRGYSWGYWNRTAEGDAAATRLAELEAKVDRLTEALSFYADPGTYHACAFRFDQPAGGFDDDFSDDHGEAFYDRSMPGKLAREVLHEVTP